jgi:hypothetical protein
MPERWKAIVTNSSFRFALLLAQCIVYWTFAIHKLGESVPVAYQRF